MRVCLVEIRNRTEAKMLRVENTIWPDRIHDTFRHKTPEVCGYWLLCLVLDQINILSGLFLREFRPQITVVAMTRKELKYCCGSGLFLFEWEVKTRVRRVRKVSTLHCPCRFISMFTVLTWLLVAIHYCLFTRGQQGTGQESLSLTELTWTRGTHFSSPVTNITASIKL